MMYQSILPPVRTMLLAAGILIFSTSIRAQSVDSLIREAYKNNPQLESLARQADAAVFRAAAAGAMPAPSLAIEFSQVPTNSTNFLNDGISDNISFSQMFMLGGKLSAMSAVEKKKGALLEHTRASLLVKVRAAVKLNYVQLWRLDRQIEIQQKTIGILESLASSLQSRVQTNRARSADLLTEQAEAASERARLSDLRAKRSALENILLSLTTPAKPIRDREMRMNMTDPPVPQDGRPSPSPQGVRAAADPRPAFQERTGAGARITPDSILPALPLFVSTEELTEELLSSNPSLLSMDHMKGMNDAMIDAAQKELIPDLMLQVMVMRMPNGMVLTGGPRSTEMIRQAVDGMAMKTTEWMYSLMASVTLPFAPWSSERSTAKADEMRSMNQSVNAEKMAMQREMLSSLNSAVNTYYTQESLVIQYRDSILPLTHDAAAAQTAAYQTGQATLSAVLDAYRMELMKTDEYVMTIMNQHMALIDIEMMVGVPLQ